jgi:lactoylglutathione lyase
MQVAHVGLWTSDLEVAADFWRAYFGAEVGAIYHSQRRPGFVSRFVSLPLGDVKIELMKAHWVEDGQDGDRVGWDHVAICVGDDDLVDRIAARCNVEGCLIAAPRRTGDGFYEAIIRTPDGISVEITGPMTSHVGKT